MSLLNSIEKFVTCRRVTSPNVLQYANEKRNKGTFNDVTIEAGSETIAANRMILSCCSRFFEGMFELEMKEKYQNPVQVNGVDGKAVKALVDFMYSGEVKINNENVMDLIAASDYLQVDEVKQFCFDFLKSILCVDNWFAIRAAASLYHDEGILVYVFEYVSNHFDEVTASNDFKFIAYDDLIAFVSKLNRSVVKETSVIHALITWIKHDSLNRKNLLLTLFKTSVELQKVPVEKLKNLIVKEELVVQNHECLVLLTEFLIERYDNTNTRLISLGGTNTGKECVELYNVDNKPRELYPDLPVKLDCHCSVKSANSLYCIGGRIMDSNGEYTSSSSVWQLNLVEKAEWKEISPLSQPHCLMGATVFHDMLVVAGGNSVEYFHVAFKKWKLASSMQQSRDCNALVACGDYLFAVGGVHDGKCLSCVERMSILDGDWENVQRMRSPRKWFAAVNCNNYIYAIGGCVNEAKQVYVDTVEKYDVAADKWMFVRSMNIRRCGHAACVINGKIFVAGGTNASGLSLHEIECYDPATDSWCVVGNTDINLTNHSLIAV